MVVGSQSAHVDVVAQTLTVPCPGKMQLVMVAVEAQVLPEGVVQAVVSVGRSVGGKNVVVLLVVVELVVDEVVVSGVVVASVKTGSEMVTVVVSTGGAEIRHPWKVVVVVASTEQPDTVVVLIVEQVDDERPEKVRQSTTKSVTVVAQDVVVLVAESVTEHPTTGSQVEMTFVVDAPTEVVVTQIDAVSFSQLSGSEE